VYGEKQPIKIEAKAISTGSFEVVLQAVSSGWDTLTALMDGSSAQHAKLLLDWLSILGFPSGGVVGLYRWLHLGSQKRKLGSFYLRLTAKH
jgi:hypothetical protein